MSREKELDFFILEKNWTKGLDWYQSNFCGDALIYGEASHNYTFYPYFKGVPERIRAILPDSKLIYVVRDPIDRIVYHYVHNFSEWRENKRTENKSLAEALGNFQNSSYIWRSQYYMQLQQYVPHFSSAHILVVSLEELEDARLPTLQKVFRFLEVDDTFYAPQFLFKKNKTRAKRKYGRVGTALLRWARATLGSALHPCLQSIGFALIAPFSRSISRPVLDDGLRERLANYLREDANRLREYTGCSFDGWEA